MLLPLDACAGRADVGGKAERLARARAAGLPVPDGVVLLPGAPVDDAALAEALARLAAPDARFAVRSSSSMEDAAGATGAGVFESVIGARGLDEVKAAIARVRASVEGEAARAYLAARGAPPVMMAVLIQPVVAAPRFGVARGEQAFLVEERDTGEPEWGDVDVQRLDPQAGGALADGLRALVPLVGGPLDAEYARRGDAVTFLQARPAPRPPADEPAPFALAGHWRLDAEHNPEPLSAAQAGLVDFVEALAVGSRQRVIDGWLFVERGAPPRGLSPLPLGELRRRFDDEVATACEAALAPVEAAPALEPALAAYAVVYRLTVGQVAPTLARGRQQLDQFLRMNLGEPLAAHGALVAGSGGLTVARDQALWALGRGEAALADVLARFGMYAPAWDVAVAPDDEAPDRVRAAAALLARDPRSPAARHEAALADAEAAAHALLERLDRMARRAFKALLPTVRAALPVAEDDDLLFFRAQRVARRALLSVGETLRAAGRLDAAAAVFDLPLALARQPDASDLRARVAQARAERTGAARRHPPLAVDDGRARWPAPGGEVLRGHATAGRARGRAFVLRPADPPATLPPDAVLVLPAMLPSLTYLLPAARALVTAHGGATSHGATLAREYGVPAVLGVAHAAAIADGAALYVDGAAGRVYLL
jgi:phosphohistidine swiveling domain-containing protein